MTEKSKKTVNLADLSRLDSITEAVYVEVPHKDEVYGCYIELIENGSVLIRTDVIPKGHHIEGLLFSGYDESRKGLEVREILGNQDLYPTYWEDRISYVRAVSGRPSNGLVDVVKRFVIDVHQASADIERILVQYISSLPKKLDPKFKKYKDVI